jgi:hemolysin activation/secretion protein
VLSLTSVHAQLRSTARVHVTAFRFEGNTVFTDAQLAGVIAKYVGQDVSRDDLEDARRAVTLHYVQAGYINSGAILPDQPVKDGVITFRIVEGRLTRIVLSGNHWLLAGAITNRFSRWDGPPLNIQEVRDGLQLLRQDPNIEQVNAELRPDFAPGESLLDLRVKDRQPFRAGLQLDNARAPSVNSMELLLVLADRNLTGHSDGLDVSYGIADGNMESWKFSDLNNVSGSYALPVTRWDTTLRVFGNKNDYAIVDEAFVSQNIDIQSVSYRYGASLRQPVYQTANRELAVGATFEHRYSQSEVNGRPYPLPGAPDGVTQITALRLSQEWTDRSVNQVLALRSTVSLGIDGFGTTDDGSDRDGRFVAWLGQAQYARRLFDTQNQLILRADAQWSDGELLSLEQFSLGGVNSVRGYRENQAVRDQGVFGSIEFRVPVLFNRLGSPVVQLAPFFDIGAGRDLGVTRAARQLGATRTDTLYSAGIGVLVNPCANANASLYWGYAFRDFHTPENDPQDLGLHFRVNINAF